MGMRLLKDRQFERNRFPQEERKQLQIPGRVFAMMHRIVECKNSLSLPDFACMLKYSLVCAF